MERESMTDLRNRDARRSRWLAAAIAADLLLVVMQAVACAMYRAPHTGDAQSYWELALYCAQNHTFYPSPRDEFALYIFGNGYVNLLSLLLRLRETYAWVYAVNMAFTHLLVFSVYRIMRRLCEGREAACAAVTLLCLLPALWGEAASSRTELCFMGLAFASLACAMEDGTGWHALSGVLMALCNWVRPLMVILLPMTLLLLILRKKRLRCIAAYLLGAAVPGHMDKERYEFCWIVDFPMYEIGEESGELEFCHNPFSMPNGGLEILEKAERGEVDPLSITAFQYDLVCNGVELSSGAVRNHDPEIMIKAFEMVRLGEDDVKAKFPAMYNAFCYGAPPHAGIAPGVDRMVMLLAGEDSIREIIPFPMNKNAQDVMMGAPSTVEQKQLDELNIAITCPVEE